MKILAAPGVTNPGVADPEVSEVPGSAVEVPREVR